MNHKFRKMSVFMLNSVSRVLADTEHQAAASFDSFFCSVSNKGWIMFVLVEKIALSGNYGKVFWEGRLNFGCYVHAHMKFPLKFSNVMLRVWKRDKLINFIKVSVLLVCHNVTMPPQSRLLREETSSRLNVNSLPVKKTHVIHNWEDDKLQIIHESFIFNFCHS